jgi:polysaccharide export outer membrane protein
MKLSAGFFSWVSQPLIRFTIVFSRGGWLAAVIALVAGCQTSGPIDVHRASSETNNNAKPTQVVVFREGDSVKITFPNAPKLDSTQKVRRDGKIVLPVFGEIQASGLTPSELEKEVLKEFGSQLVTKEVSVILESSSYPVFITGAVVHAGKITAERPLTALEAIMEAGGFDYAKANLKNVKVIRTEEDGVKTFTLDFRGVLKGQKSNPFYLKPSDILYISEKFTLF